MSGVAALSDGAAVQLAGADERRGVFVSFVAALVIGNHILNETVAVIRWRGASVGTGWAIVLWSIPVLS